MKIGVDARLFFERHLSGVKIYSFNLLYNTFKKDRGNTYILFYNSFNKKTPVLIKKFLEFENVRLKRLYWPNKLLNLSILLFNRPRLDKILKVKTFYFPNITFIALSKDCRYFLTIHDASFILFPEFLNFKRKLWHFLVNPRRLAQNANKIITVSKSSRDDILKYFLKNKSQPKIKVIKPGINHLEISQSDEKFVLPQKPYILILSTLEPRKNINSTIIAYSYLIYRQKIDHNLVIAGEEGWLTQETKNLIKIQIAKNKRLKDKIIFLKVKSEKNKEKLVRSAALLVFPSFYEGFGFPPLEALKNRTPVIVSNTSSLAENCSKKTLIINPQNRYELIQAIQLSLKTDIQMLIQEKNRQTNYEKEYNWQISANQLIAHLNQN
ncbi:MAG: glycosyltransferase [Candidatus Moranbacteria bacterium]|nr:glycosyltransferase [Candidatus Moranbacteria bacterium]